MRKKQLIFTSLGVLLLLSALLFAGYNLFSEIRATDEAKKAFEKLGFSSFDELSADEAQKQKELPEYVLDPNMPMPEKEIDGYKYIGYISIPALSVKLPVMSDWSYEKLTVSPCRYFGSAYLGNLIVAAHNYRNHFGRLSELSPGDKVVFVDMKKNVFKYRVTETELLEPEDVEELKSGNWDLTLFTCTVGGQYRVTVRCEASKK